MKIIGVCIFALLVSVSALASDAPDVGSYKLTLPVFPVEAAQGITIKDAVQINGTIDRFTLQLEKELRAETLGWKPKLTPPVLTPLPQVGRNPWKSKKFWAVQAINIAAAVADVESTYNAIGRGGVEANPIMKPFINAGRPATYGVKAGLGLFNILNSAKLYRNRNDNVWMAPPLISAGVQGTAATLNWTRDFTPKPGCYQVNGGSICLGN